VMAIGGFNGNGGELTLSQFEQDVAKGDIHYYIVSGGGMGGGGAPGDSRGGGGGPGAGSSNSSSITTWVEGHFKAQTVGGQTVYNLTQRS
jgi:hypothetical protein